MNYPGTWSVCGKMTTSWLAYENNFSLSNISRIIARNRLFAFGHLVVHTYSNLVAFPGLDDCWRMALIISTTFNTSLVRPYNWPVRRIWLPCRLNEVHRKFGHSHGGHARRKVAEENLLLKGCSNEVLNGGTYIAAVEESIYKAKDRHIMNTFCCKTYLLVWAMLQPPLYLLCVVWTTNSVLWTMTVVTTLLPFSDHGEP